MLTADIIIRGSKKRKEVSAMVDSGAGISLISKRLAEEVGYEISNETMNIAMADETTISCPIGYIIMELGSCDVRMPVAIFDKLVEELLIGLDMLKELGVKIDMGNGELSTDRCS